ncbi:MAG TPA: hypothetical protein DEB70_06760 [Planctomycetaceae bacterium]|nr:hypothetical protein [Planctomycetaceae bacterium]
MVRSRLPSFSLVRLWLSTPPLAAVSPQAVSASREHPAPRSPGSGQIWSSLTAKHSDLDRGMLPD